MKFWFDHGVYVYAENAPNEEFHEDDVEYIVQEFHHWLMGYCKNPDGSSCGAKEAVARHIAFSRFPNEMFKVFLKKHPYNFDGYAFDTLATNEVCKKVADRIYGQEKRETVTIDLQKDLYDAFKKEMYLDEVYQNDCPRAC